MGETKKCTFIKRNISLLFMYFVQIKYVKVVYKVLNSSYKSLINYKKSSNIKIKL